MAVFKKFLGNSNTIYDCCKVIFHILFGLGCTGIIKQNGRLICSPKSLLYTLLAVFWIIGSLTGSLYIVLQNPQVKKLDRLVRSIIYLEIIMSMFIYLATVASMLFNVKTHLELYQRLHELDQKLIKLFSCKLCYHKLIVKHIILMSSVAIFYVTVISVAVSQSSHGQEIVVNLLAGLAYTAMTGGPHLTGYAQMNMAEVLQIRFRLLQKLLRKQVVCSARLNVQQQIDYLRCLIVMVQDYHNCVPIINKLYAVPLTTTMLHDFTLTTSEFYLIFGGSLAGNTSLIFYVILCMLLPMYKMTIAPIYCEKAIKEGLKCFKIIKDTDLWFPGNCEVQQMISTCLLWSWENKIQFSVSSLIFNKEIIAMVYSQIFNYLLILIQFRMTEEMGNEIEKQKNRIQEWIGVDYV